MPLVTLSRPRQKTPRLRRIERTLDTLERRFVRAVRRLLVDRVRELEPVVEQALATGRLDNLTLPEPGAYERLLVAFVVEAYGAGMGHGQAEVDDLRRNQARRALLAGPDGEPVVPEGAVGFVRSRRDLARFFEKDQAETVRRVITEGLEQGQSLKQVMGSLEEALPGKMGRARLENIARTEATTAYNQGRLAMFLDTEGFIAGVEFMAILDARTTDICQHRDGLVFRLDDPAIRLNTPPLHYQCRSILSPVPVTALKESDLERTSQRMATAPDPQVTKKGRFGNEPWPDVQGGDGAAPMPRAKPVGPKGPSGGEAARPERTPLGPKGGDDGEARAPEREAEGDGGAKTEQRVETEPTRSPKRPKEQPVGGEEGHNRKPRLSPARPTEDYSSETRKTVEQPITSGDGGVGYTQWPMSYELRTFPIRIGSRSVELRDFWDAFEDDPAPERRGEWQRVSKGLRLMRSECLENIDGVRFTNSPIIGRFGPANGQYDPTTRVALLSRMAARNWTNGADDPNRRLALKTLWHEMAHHVWFEDFNAKGSDNLRLRRLWAKALDADSIHVPGLERVERFAELFAEYMDNPEVFIASHPNTGGFYRDNMAYPSHKTRIEDP